GIVLADRCRAVLADGERLIHTHRGRALVLHLDRLVVLDQRGAIVLHLLAGVVADLDRAVMLDDGAQVLLGMQVDLLGVLLVFEAQFVEILGRAALAAAALDAALRGIGRQAVRRLVGAVVHAAGDDRLVRVTV